MLAYAITTVTETPATLKCCLYKTGDFAGKSGQVVWTVIMFVLFDHEVLFNRDHDLLF